MTYKKHEMTIAENAIYRLIESLYQLLLLGITKKEKLDTLKKNCATLDANNEDFAAIRESTRESMKKYWYLILMIICVLIDFFLLYQPMDILCSTFYFPTWIKYAVPIMLISLEVGIAYSQILRQRDARHSPWFVRNLQYLVIVMLIAASTLLIIFSIESYNPAIDHISFIGFLSGTILFQGLLLCASIMLHVWLIRSAEILSETHAYFMYLVAWKKLAAQIEHLEKENKETLAPNFKKDSQHLVYQIGLFKRMYPDADIQFEKAMPEDLIRAINIAMGKMIFSEEAAQVV